jgi:hypothetical protein
VIMCSHFDTDRMCFFSLPAFINSSIDRDHAISCFNRRRAVPHPQSNISSLGSKANPILISDPDVHSQSETKAQRNRKRKNTEAGEMTPDRITSEGSSKRAKVSHARHHEVASRSNRAQRDKSPLPSLSIPGLQ